MIIAERKFLRVKIVRAMSNIVSPGSRQLFVKSHTVRKLPLDSPPGRWREIVVIDSNVHGALAKVAPFAMDMAV